MKLSKRQYYCVKEGRTLSHHLTFRTKGRADLCAANLIREVKLESLSQPTRRGHGSVHGFPCARPWYHSCILTFCFYPSGQDTSSPRIPRSTGFIAIMKFFQISCFLGRGQEESVRLTRQLIRISTEWDTTECQAYQLLNMHHTNFVFARTSARHLSSTWIINKYMLPASSLGN